MTSNLMMTTHFPLQYFRVRLWSVSKLYEQNLQCMRRKRLSMCKWYSAFKTTHLQTSFIHESKVLCFTVKSPFCSPFTVISELLFPIEIPELSSVVTPVVLLVLSVTANSTVSVVVDTSDLPWFVFMDDMSSTVTTVLSPVFRVTVICLLLVVIVVSVSSGGNIVGVHAVG